MYFVSASSMRTTILVKCVCLVLFLLVDVDLGHAGNPHKKGGHRKRRIAPREHLKYADRHDRGHHDAQLSNTGPTTHDIHENNLIKRTVPNQQNGNDHMIGSENEKLLSKLYDNLRNISVTNSSTLSEDSIKHIYEHENLTSSGRPSIVKIIHVPGTRDEQHHILHIVTNHTVVTGSLPQFSAPSNAPRTASSSGADPLIKEFPRTTKSENARSGIGRQRVQTPPQVSVNTNSKKLSITKSSANNVKFVQPSQPIPIAKKYPSNANLQNNPPTSKPNFPILSKLPPAKPSLSNNSSSLPRSPPRASTSQGPSGSLKRFSSPLVGSSHSQSPQKSAGVEPHPSQASQFLPRPSNPPGLLKRLSGPSPGQILNSSHFPGSQSSSGWQPKLLPKPVAPEGLPRSSSGQGPSDIQPPSLPNRSPSSTPIRPDLSRSVLHPSLSGPIRGAERPHMGLQLPPTSSPKATKQYPAKVSLPAAQDPSKSSLPNSRRSVSSPDLHSGSLKWDRHIMSFTNGAWCLLYPYKCKAHSNYLETDRAYHGFADPKTGKIKDNFKGNATFQNFVTDEYQTSGIAGTDHFEYNNMDGYNTSYPSSNTHPTEPYPDVPHPVPSYPHEPYRHEPYPHEPFPPAPYAYAPYAPYPAAPYPYEPYPIESYPIKTYQTESSPEQEAYAYGPSNDPYGFPKQTLPPTPVKDHSWGQQIGFDNYQKSPYVSFSEHGYSDNYLPSSQHELDDQYNTENSHYVSNNPLIYNQLHDHYYSKPSEQKANIPKINDYQVPVQYQYPPYNTFNREYDQKYLNLDHGHEPHFDHEKSRLDSSQYYNEFNPTNSFNNHKLNNYVNRENNFDERNGDFSNYLGHRDYYRENHESNNRYHDLDKNTNYKKRSQNMREQNYDGLWSNEGIY